MVAHPHQVEEEEFAFGRMYGARHWVSADSGYCCLANFGGGDCCHTMTAEDCNPSAEEMIADGFTRDGSGQWVEVASLCSVDGRPVPPVR